MKFVDFVKMGFKNLFRKKIRTFLTVLSVSIGAFAIIIMVSLGIGMNESFKKQIMENGSLNLITVDPYYYPEDTKNYTPVEPKKIDDTVVETLSQIPNVKYITPTMRFYGSLKAGRYESGISIVGIDSSQIKYFDFPMVSEGVMLDENNKTGLLFGNESTWFYNPNSRNYNTVEVDVMKERLALIFRSYTNEVQKQVDVKVKAAGKLENTTGDKNWSVYVDIDELKKYKNEYYSILSAEDKKREQEKMYDNVWIIANNVKNVEKIQKTIKEMGFGAYSLGDSLKSLQQTARTLQLILGGIGALSLFISAIGIANTMIMATYERTKEIGILKVLGCKVGDIKKLFLFESSIIGILGGITGLGLSYGISFVLNRFGSGLLSGMFYMPTGSAVSYIPWWLGLLGVGFSFLIGIISGYFPAQRATRIKALEALKTE